MESITLVKDAIHRPDEPRHFMQFKFPGTQYTAHFQDREVANTSAPLILSEVGYGIYDPVVYFPLEDVDRDALQRIDKTTVCPLKGETDYFSMSDANNEQGAEVAWSYAKPYPFAAKLKDYMAFDARKIKIRAVE